MIWNRFNETFQNLHFADNKKDDKTDKAFKMRPVIDHLNSKLFEMLSNYSEQSTDEHMVKLKDWSGMKQYAKLKPIKCGFTFWFRCSIKSSHLSQMGIYLGKKKHPHSI